MKPLPSKRMGNWWQRRSGTVVIVDLLQRAAMENSGDHAAGLSRDLFGNGLIGY